MGILFGPPSSPNYCDFGQYWWLDVYVVTLQILAIYDRFGRLAYGSEKLAKDCLEYVVFEKHVADEYGCWRIHGKLVPNWLPKQQDVIRTLRRPGFVAEELKSEPKSEPVEQKDENVATAEVAPAWFLMNLLMLFMVPGDLCPIGDLWNKSTSFPGMFNPRLAQSSGPCAQSKLHRSGFQVPAEDIFVCTVLAHVGNLLAMCYINLRIDIVLLLCH